MTAPEPRRESATTATARPTPRLTRFVVALVLAGLGSIPACRTPEPHAETLARDETPAPADSSDSDSSDGDTSRTPARETGLLERSRGLALALVATDLAAREAAVEAVATVATGTAELTAAFVTLLASPEHCAGAARALAIAAEWVPVPRAEVEARLQAATGACRIETARLLWNTDPQATRAVRIIVEGLSAKDAAEREAAAGALRNYDYEQKAATALESEREAIVEALAGPDPRVREAAALALAHVTCDVADIPTVVEAIERLEPGTSESAALALGRAGDTAQAAVEDLLRSDSAALRRLGRVAARAMGPDAGTSAVPILLEQIADSTRSAEVRDAVSTASFLGVGACLELLRVLPRAMARERITAVNALGSYGAEAAPAVDELVALLGDEDPEIRYAASYSLRGVGAASAPGAAGALERVVRGDSVTSVRVAARLALETVAPERVPSLPTLEEIFAQ